MSNNAEKLQLKIHTNLAPAFKVRSIGDILIDCGYSTPSDVASALAKQTKSEASLGEILLASKGVTAYDLQKAISLQSEMELVSQPFPAMDNETKSDISVREMLKYNFAPIAYCDHQMKIAVSDPNCINSIKKICERHDIQPQFVLSSRSVIHAHIAKIGKKYLSKSAELVCPEGLSCRRMMYRGKNYPVLFSLFFLAIFLGVLGWLEGTIFLIALTTFVGNGVLKCGCLLAYLYKKDVIPPPPKSHEKLERVSILVPLYKESYIVERLLKRLIELDYPKELLEIFLICEEDDTKTQLRISHAPLPPHISMVVAPMGEIQTKPRAMNYALNFCKGSIIGVYDAEDAPEYDQVYKAVRHLQQSDPRVVCVQARLDFFNQNTNWLARCFTIEYATLFRVILRGLQKLDLPIPLGGTSMFIQRKALVEWGQWDAHNVTEDADLGIRLYRQGLRVECLDSTTYEEANYKFKSWVKQRSRWLKGFIVTWITHMRTPRRLLADLGIASFLAFNALLLGTVITYLMIPLLLPYWLLSLGITPPIIGTLPHGVLPVMLLVLVLGEPLLFLLGYFATTTQKHKPLRPTLLTMFAYWPLASLAAYKAIYELITAPTYWDKTEHGLNDHQYSEVIANLTLPEWRH
jgi:cellulose synthase/poly-beta-1,6-N-acetylglucosamine synthase-like glycosyltransferase